MDENAEYVREMDISRIFYIIYWIVDTKHSFICR